MEGFSIYVENEAIMDGWKLVAWCHERPEVKRAMRLFAANFASLRD